MLKDLAGVIKELAAFIKEPLHFFALAAVLLASLVAILFRKSSDTIRLSAFVILVFALGGLSVALFVPPPKVAPDAAAEAKIGLPPIGPRQVEPALTAFVYYEVGKDGRPTRDGQLEVLPSGSSLPDFRDIRRDQVLRTLSAVNMRNPSPNNDRDLKKPPVATLRAGTCVKTVADADPDEETIVRRARSGGWLQVSVIPCPS